MKIKRSAVKKLFILALLAVPFLSNAQKLKFDNKTNQFSVDGVNSFMIDRIGSVSEWHFDIYDKDSIKVIRVNYRDFNSPAERIPANPKGIVRYYEFIFLASKTKAEIEWSGGQLKLGKIIFNEKLIVDGKLNDKGVEEFVLVHGTPFSERVKF